MIGYKIEIMGQKDPTYITTEEVVKLVKAANARAKLVYVGGDFVNPASIGRLKKVWNIEPSLIEKSDEEMVALLGGNKRINL